jgi:hypothetical protein
VSGYYDRSGKYRRPGSTGSTSRRGSEGWWTYAAARPANRIGISPELPAARTVGWNIAFITAEAAGCAVAHYACGVPWWQLAAGFAAVLALGVAAFAYVVTIATPRALARHHARLRSHALGYGAAVPPRPVRSSARTADTTGTGRAA